MRRALSLATIAFAAALAATAVSVNAWAEKPPALDDGDAPVVVVAPVFVPPPAPASVPAAPVPAPPALVAPALVAPVLVPTTSPGSHLGNDKPVTGTPAPAGTALPGTPITGTPITGTPITGDDMDLSPSERLAGREAALRFRFQQQLLTGEVPWPLRDWKH